LVSPIPPCSEPPCVFFPKPDILHPVPLLNLRPFFPSSAAFGALFQFSPAASSKNPLPPPPTKPHPPHTNPTQTPPQQTTCVAHRWLSCALIFFFSFFFTAVVHSRQKSSRPPPPFPLRCVGLASKVGLDSWRTPGTPFLPASPRAFHRHMIRRLRVTIVFFSNARFRFQTFPRKDLIAVSQPQLDEVIDSHLHMVATGFFHASRPG